MTFPLLAALPWALILVWAAWRIRRPRPLPPAGRSEEIDGRARGAEGEAAASPLVSVIVPARNEEETIVPCVSSLVRSGYPDFEVLVVDDRSEDRTGELARSVDPGRARRLRVLEGTPRPDGWLGKPWACWQGFQEAEGELLLFTDADTVHGPELLERAAAALEEDGVAAVSVVGRQRLETFWEKVVQPQVLALIGFRFPGLDRPIRPGRCRHAIASGGFILVHRGPYRGIGGHEGVRGEVAEDLRLAQRLCRAGYAFSVREAEEDLEVRMYRSLAHLIEGWTKNLSIGAAQTLPPRIRTLARPLMLAVGFGLWLVPPLLLAAFLAGVGGTALGLWSGAAVGLSALFWCGVAREVGIAPPWGLLYPLGSAVGAYIFVRSWLRGRTVEWKGRTYEMDEAVLSEE